MQGSIRASGQLAIPSDFLVFNCVRELLTRKVLYQASYVCVHRSIKPWLDRT